MSKWQNIAEIYDKLLHEMAIPVQDGSELVGENIPVSFRLAHCRWMCQQIKNMTDDEKAMRWICFIQGVLWVLNLRTIKEMRDDNRNV